jgi:hypothetical protein
MKTRVLTMVDHDGIKADAILLFNYSELSYLPTSWAMNKRRLSSYYIF